MKKISKSTATIVVVVDANPSDYVALTPLAESGEIDLRFLLSGRSALRESRYFQAPLWMINVHLPDRSGFDLFEMSFRGKTRPLVLMVADQYRAEDEQRALELGIAKYFCKPVDPAWLHDCLKHIKLEANHETPVGRLKHDHTKNQGSQSRQGQPGSNTADAIHDVKSDYFVRDAPQILHPFFEGSDS